MTACLTETTVQLLPRNTFRIEYFSRYEREVKKCLLFLLKLISFKLLVFVCCTMFVGQPGLIFQGVGSWHIGILHEMSDVVVKSKNSCGVCFCVSVSCVTANFSSDN